MWLLVKSSLLLVMYCWRHNVSWVRACLSQLALSVATLLWWQTLFWSLMKNVHHVNTKQHWGIKSRIWQSKNSTTSQAVCASALTCWKV